MINLFFFVDQDLPSSHFLTPSNAQRLKHVRRVESTHVSSGPGAKTSKILYSFCFIKIKISSSTADLITPDSWRTEPVVTKKSSSIAQQEKSSRQKTAAEIISKRTKIDIEESLDHHNQRTTEKIIKPKRDTSMKLKTSDVSLFDCF